jgi:hypothetical protein
MLPEELNRTIEFIIQSQARLAAAQEQDREERIKSEKASKTLDRRLAGVLETLTRLLAEQSGRLDGYERESIAAEKRHREAQTLAQTRHEEFLALWEKRHQETVASLRHILEKLTDRPN